MWADSREAGDWMHRLMARLFPICRSITGPGVRETLAILAEEGIPLAHGSVPSGTPCFDWDVPDEWIIRDAYVADESGRRVIDFQASNLHVMSYSVSVDATMSLEELRPHLYTLPDQPDAIPYRTSYYRRDWGFCLRHRDLEALQPGRYRVRINADLVPGMLDYGELLLPGDSEQEVLLATNICHPSMANNELSGVAMLAALARHLAAKPRRRLSYRLLWLPETIGAIAYLSRHADILKQRVIAGYQVVCVGGPADFLYLSSRWGNTLADRAALHVLRHVGGGFRTRDYTHRGSDERQWCSPGIDLPVGSVMRSKYHEYAEYHTSLDDLGFVTAEHMAASFDVYCRILDVLDGNRCLKVATPCEPRLGKYGLYGSVGGASHRERLSRLALHLSGWCDGRFDLVDIAERHDLPAWEYFEVADRMEAAGLLKPLA